MNKEIEIPEGYEARIEGNKVILEPKESEDERIRKVLLRCCYDWDSGRSSCVAIGDVPAIRAYLEKQKDEAQKQFNLGVQAGREEVMYEMEKEQKSIEDNGDERIRNKIIGVLEEIQNDEDWVGTGWIPDGIAYLEKQKEQKSADWSEEDEKMLDDIAGCLEAFSLQTRSLGADVPEKVEWLKTHFQPKRGWTEEDEKNLNWLIEQFDFLQPHKEGFYVLKVRPWLVSLPTRFNPQPHWKPSEEQMRALKHAVEHYKAEGYHGTGDRLYELHEDLKRQKL